jgi:hypothetical protein
MATTGNQCELHREEGNVSTGTGSVQRHAHHEHGAEEHSQETMQGIQRKAKNIASDIASTTKERGQRAASRAKDKTAAFLADRQHQAASKIEGVAEAARRAAETLREQGDENVAGYAETAADQVAELSRYLRDRRPNDLLHDLEDAATRHPALVYGGLFVAGLAISRFLKASERSHGYRGHEESGSWS